MEGAAQRALCLVFFQHGALGGRHQRQIQYISDELSNKWAGYLCLVCWNNISFHTAWYKVEQMNWIKCKWTVCTQLYCESRVDLEACWQGDTVSLQEVYETHVVAGISDFTTNLCFRTILSCYLRVWFFCADCLQDPQQLYDNIKSTALLASV